MQKAIIILTGTPSGKVKFDRVITKRCWRWNVSAKNWLAEVAKNKLYWSAIERDEEYHRTLANFYAFVNEVFNFESQYIQESIQRFQAFDAEQMSRVDGNDHRQVFTKFLLVIHGISKELTGELEAEEGAMQIHITNHTVPTNIKAHDLVYYEDDENFEEQINKLIDSLTNQKEITVHV